MMSMLKTMRRRLRAWRARRDAIIILPPLRPKKLCRDGSKPHAARTESVRAILDAAPVGSTYDELVQFVRDRSGVACSRKLVSKWKKEKGSK